MVFNVKLFDTTRMFARSHLRCCFSCKPAWFVSLSGGFSGLLVLAVLWRGARNQDLAVARCSCADKGVSVSCQAAHGCFIPRKELFSLHLAGLEVFSLDLL